MESGLRDLFIELPSTLFDLLKLLGEQAVTDAQERRSAQENYRLSLDPFRSGAIASALCERYGWTKSETQRSAMRRSTILLGKLSCGHWSNYELTDNVIEDSAPRTLLRVVDDLVARGRSCLCMQRTVFG